MITMVIGRATSGISSSTIVLRAALRRWHRRMAHLFDPYRPELYYMRGPGPKWFEKHGGTT